MPIVVDHLSFFVLLFFYFVICPSLSGFVKISVVLACLSFSLGRSALRGRIPHLKINVAVGEKK